MPFSLTDTIVAVATPAGRGGIGVVRLSGPDACGIARMLTGRVEPLEPRHATFARIVDPDSRAGRTRALDQVVLTWFQAPHSYTGDDVVEISGHGSPVLLQRIVELAMRDGARLAEPGEFTLRAYLNDRMDLVQAEAVADLIEAVTPLQARAAMDQLEGTLTKEIARIDAAVFDLSARLEASLDFPEEGFHFVTRDAARAELARVHADLVALAAQGRTGRVLREGRMVVIVGRPNAGKSSLFNALVGAGRAIVTEIPGTTRDVLTERVDIGGVPVTLVDTAGLRDAADAIEAEGVERAQQARRIAALTLVVIDRSQPVDDDDRRILEESPRPRVIAASKADLPAAWTPASAEFSSQDAVEVSVLTGRGLSVLRDRIVAILAEREDLRDPPAISNVRHLELVSRAAEWLDAAIRALDAGATEELVLTDLGSARRALEELTGRRTPEDLLRHIFSKFCVGK
ncbi:MAG TPA: tRNA uridine-5-carboxymethylaminomethyl(34) synthesis GTPase MnmE [Vicinamibacterales bacterium]|nr:tRNA uridine-5-carboxymethylaminomethyl(34) synthesis GTPase MnmE [Vicinamibacterales bacterium]